MAEALSNRRFASYLALSCLVLIALAALGPATFIIGLSAIVVAEVAMFAADHDIRDELQTLNV